MCHLTLSKLREELVGGDKEISLPHWVVILTLQCCHTRIIMSDLINFSNILCLRNGFDG